MKTVLIIGYGAIGQYVADRLHELERVRIGWVVCREGAKERAARMIGGDAIAVSSIDEVRDQVDLAVECAGHGALAEHGVEILRRGTDLLAASSGALCDRDLEEDLAIAARHGQSQLRITSGAIGAMDALSAAAASGLKDVVYRGRKPPRGWAGSQAENLVDLKNLTEPFRHFRGTAREAAKQYPKNANVAATIALAGVGFDDTTVELIADPGVSANIHELEASGDFGRLHFSIEGQPLSGNPRSSMLTALSLVRAVTDIDAAIVV